MLKKEMMYSLRDISIIPSVVTDIKSRSECYPFRPSIDGADADRLPVITAPMSCVLNENNYEEFLASNVNVIIPRTVDLDVRETLMFRVFCAFSMSEVKYLIEKYSSKEWKDELKTPMCILIDNANGHMKSHLELGKQLKRTFGDRVLVMGGNIANPNTYLSYEFAGFDYVRCGIGGGNCCFTAGTKITMSDGSKKVIEDVVIGDIVMTKDGPRMVTGANRSSVYNIASINDKIRCTLDHQFYTVKKDDIERLESGEVVLDEVGYYEEVINLTGDNLLVKKIGNVIELEEFYKIDRINSKTAVDMFELEVEDGHSFIAEDYVVHNCITSTQTACHYSMASLIADICELRPKEYHCKVVADGGISGYSDIIKCLALGADYVMCGKVFAKAALSSDEVGDSHLYYGMSTKMAQKEMGNTKLKTSEGRKETVIKEYTLTGWTENLHDYICSAMSYCDSRNLDEFKDKAICRVLSSSASSLINDK